MNVPIDKMVLVTLSAKPVLWKSVLKMMPMDSPQLTMQNALSATMKYIGTVRLRLMAMQPRREKSSADTISNGTSSMVYETKNASREYARSSFSYERSGMVN